MVPRFLVSDIDGTLLDTGGRLSEINEHALRRLVERGLPVTLATGRTAAATLPLARRLGIRLPVVTFNGAQVVKEDGTVCFQQHLAPEAVDAVVRLAGRSALAGFVYGRSGITPVAGGERLRDHLLIEDREHLLPPWPAGATGHAPWWREGGAVKVLLLAPDPEAADAFAREAARPEFGHLFGLLRSAPDCVEVMAPGVSKAAGLAYLLRWLRLRPAEVVAVGNALNDLQMIQLAGAGVAVLDAEPELLAAADFVAPPASEHAVAAVVRRFFPQAPLDPEMAGRLGPVMGRRSLPTASASWPVPAPVTSLQPA
ncbi:HAD family hydrolase [Carboxydochorda subterranea]|uniref:HAD family hydrolase n=1 Tax=Carboxydichorda subterranea TaxID=3109565 RepID=A0ABZ1C0H9_9FIRM|nr:HAD family hydrolase [Limnochorda sp. L945t]WRP17818.1 HAD family hydrolase [Limnochorda sp. L945t]